MKIPILPAIAVTSFALTFLANAQTYYWGGGTSNISGNSTPTGGSGTWNTTIQNWTLNTYSGSGNPYIAWPNTASQNAVFGGTAGTVTLGAATTTMGNLAVEASGYVFELNGARTLSTTSFSGAALSSSVFRPDSTANRTLTFNNSGNYSGSLNDNGARVLSFTKGGTGTITLSGSASSYTGATTISGGTLTVLTLANGGSNSSIGAASTAANNLLIGSGGTTAIFNYTGGSGSTDRLFTINTTNTTANQGASLAANGSGAINFTNTGAIAFGGTADTARLLTLRGLNTGNNTIASSFANNGTGALSIQKFEAGRWDLTSATSSFTGNVTVSAGTLGFSVAADGGSNSSLGASSSAASNLVIAGSGTSVLSYVGSGGSTNRLLTINAPAGTIDASGSGAISWTGTGSLAYGTADANRTVGFSGSNTGNNTFAPLIANNGTGTVSVAKAGVGTWVLTGNNSYSGTTTITAGTLIINGNQSLAGGAVSVDAGATLGGTGTIGGLSTITGSLAPGNGIGTLNVANNVTWRGASSASSATDWKFELGASNAADLLNITGDFIRSVALGNQFRFDFMGSTSTGTFKLVDWTGTTGFSASEFSYTNLGAGNTATFEINGSQLDVVVIPEPSTWILLTVGLSSVILLRRRHRF